MANLDPLTGPILLFDGECVLCNRAVLWILAHERSPRIRFASLDSATADSQLAGSMWHGHQDSILWIGEQGEVMDGADAALAVALELRTPWRWMHTLRWAPRPLRDWGYRFVARKRKQWFGQTAHCALLQHLDTARLLP